MQALVSPQRRRQWGDFCLQGKVGNKGHRFWGLRKKRLRIPQSLEDLTSKLTEEAKSLCTDNRLKQQFTVISELGPDEGTVSSTRVQEVGHPKAFTRALVPPASPGEAQVPAHELSPTEEYDGDPDRFGGPRAELGTSKTAQESCPEQPGGGCGAPRSVGAPPGAWWAEGAGRPQEARARGDRVLAAGT